MKGHYVRAKLSTVCLYRVYQCFCEHLLAKRIIVVVLPFGEYDRSQRLGVINHRTALFPLSHIGRSMSMSSKGVYMTYTMCY